MLYAFAVSALAGLSTGLGGLVVLFIRRPGPGVMAFSLAFAGGVMTTVSLADMIPHAVETYAAGGLPLYAAGLQATSLMVMGMLVALALARCIPEPEPTALVAGGGRVGEGRAVTPGVLHSAMVTTAAIILHNLPEGILTLFSSYQDRALGGALALAIALHNIPEGIAISVPVSCATGSRARGVLYALASGLAEPLGAGIAFCFLQGFLSPTFLNGLIALIAGVMLWVSAAELLPQAFAQPGPRAKGWGVTGFCVGAAVMTVGIYLV